MSDIESRKIRLGIIDLKLHNLFSIYQACKNIGYRTTVIEDNVKHYNHDIIILPGDSPLLPLLYCMTNYLTRHAAIVRWIFVNPRMIQRRKSKGGFSDGEV